MIVLLRFVEAMNLVDEQQRALVLHIAALGCLGDDLAQILDSGQHRRHLPELGAHATGEQPRQRGLPRAGRAPEDHRRQLGARERTFEQLAGSKQVTLPDEFLECARAHTLGQRLTHVRFAGGVREEIHLRKGMT
jgi:hypothetical protein